MTTTSRGQQYAIDASSLPYPKKKKTEVVINLKEEEVQILGGAEFGT